jgi:uncharacterized membrane protein
MDFIPIYVTALLLLLGLGGGGIALAIRSTFEDELDEWRRDGVVSDEQARELAARHARTATESRRRRTAQAVAILGAIAVGAGVVLFFAANWDGMSHALRFAVLAFWLAAFVVAGYALRNVRGTYPAVGHACLAIAAILFGASIFLVAQTEQWDLTSPTPFLVWTIGALAIAVVGRADAAAAIAAVAGSIWLIYQAFDATAADEEASYYLIPILLALFAAALYGVGTGAKPWLDRLGLGTGIRWVGVALALIGLFALSFRDTVVDTPRAPHGSMKAIVIAFAAAAVVGAAALAVRRARPSALWEALAVLGVTGLTLLYAFAPESAHEHEYSSRLTWYPLLFIALLALLTVGAIVVGFVNDEPWLVSAASVFAALHMVARFVDTEWPTLERGLVFAAAGLGALGLAAALERRRAEAVR